MEYYRVLIRGKESGWHKEMVVAASNHEEAEKEADFRVGNLEFMRGEEIVIDDLFRSPLEG
jgi:hypothetical protein